MDKELNRDFFVQAGKKGGEATRKKYGKPYLRKIAALGGKKKGENRKALNK